MQDRYWMFQRKGVFYVQVNTFTGSVGVEGGTLVMAGTNVSSESYPQPCLSHWEGLGDGAIGGGRDYRRGT